MRKKPGTTEEDLIATNLLDCDNNRTGTDGTGHCTNRKSNTEYSGANQVVRYAEIHDNLTLYDKLVASAPEDNDMTRVKRAELADSLIYLSDSLIYLSEGITDMQLGQEFLRAKSGNGNSYDAGDKVNALDWNRMKRYQQSVDYVRELIAVV